METQSAIGVEVPKVSIVAVFALASLTVSGVPGWLSTRKECGVVARRLDR